ncbi:MipA/OmpV family protein [Luteimonas sp. RD2P54]|uniref:MipA/OmpV family protein n=1 Tax=Luteimonas endophytica TaxID=3042023 RepID=A0ABT6J4Y4_9GAMM|nr:MipA/OmpV family protein [Luteimonas endophytica]MDH5821875.1 MipA/OmpV family protein [Luteimonas endophytica]
MTTIRHAIAGSAGLVLLALSAAAGAQSAPRVADPSTRGEWTLGVGAVAIDSPYAGEGSRLRPVPLLGFEGERAFVRGTAAGVHLLQSQGFTLDAIASVRLDGVDIDDLGRDELLANGVDAALLEDRDDGLDAGFRASYGGGWGTLALEAVHDVTDASDGYELALDYRHTWLLGRSTLTANLGSSLLSDDLAGYYYGTLEAEVARGVPAYAPGSALVHRIGMTWMHPLDEAWHLVASAEASRLPDELRDSPLLEPDSDRSGRLFLGFSRRF